MTTEKNHNSAGAQNQARDEFWLSRPCTLFETQKDKEGKRHSVKSALNTNIDTPDERLPLLEAVKVAKRGGVKSEIRAAKNALPFFGFPALFDGTSKRKECVVEFTGVYTFDFDEMLGTKADVPMTVDEARQVKAFVFAHPSIGAAWISPSGRGVHALGIGPVAKTAEEYEVIQQQFARALERTSGAKHDDSVKNVNRGLYGSNDPDLLMRSNPTFFEYNPDEDPAPEPEVEVEHESPQQSECNGEDLKAGGKRTLKQLEEQLAHISSDIKRFDWMRVLFAAKHECGEAAKDICEKWSRAEWTAWTDKDELEFSNLWRDCKQDYKRPITWGTLVKMAGGYNAAFSDWFADNLDGFVEHPNSDTPMSGQTATAYLRTIGHETTQIALIARHRETRNNLIRVSGTGTTEVRLFDGLGIWQRLSTKRGVGEAWVRRHWELVIGDFLDECSIKGGDHDTREILRKSLTTHRFGELSKGVTDIAIQHQLGTAVHEQELNQLRQGERVLLPAFGDAGGAINLAAAPHSPLVTPTEMRSQLITLSDWQAKPVSIITHESSVTALVDKYANERFKHLLARAGCWMTDTAKRIDILIAEQSGAGKSTWANILELALPGCCEFITATNAFGSSRFTPSADKLSKRRVVVVDEADKFPHEVGGNQTNQLTGSMLSVELKGQDVVQKPRLGTLLMMAGGYPHINMDEQGVADRLQWVQILDVEPMPHGDRRLLLSQEALHRWRELLYAAAFDATKLDDPWAATEEGRSTDHELLKVRTRPWLVQRILRRTFQSAESGMTWTQFKEIIEEGDEQFDITDKELGAALRRAFPTIRKKQVWNGESKPWMWPLEKQFKTEDQDW